MGNCNYYKEIKLFPLTIIFWKHSPSISLTPPPGYRQCPGESLARTVVSLMTGALLKTFDVALRGREALDCRVSSDILTRAVRVQDFVFTRREAA